MDHYGDLPGALLYMPTASSGNGAAWIAEGVTDEQRTAALTRASRGTDGQYGARYPGLKAGGRAQILGWPRTGAVDHCAGEAIPDDAVPVEIEHAVYELALAELVSPGSSAPTLTLGRITQSEKVDTIGRTFFGPGDGVAINAETLRPILTAVEDALRCILKPDSRGKLVFGKAIRG